MSAPVSTQIRVLIVEDEPTAAEALALHVERVSGFGVVAHVRSGADALRRVAPTVSLYVNDYNTAARRAYTRCGFQPAGEFATVLF